jgi:hypothetical protein
VWGRWWKQSLATCRGHCRRCHPWWGGDCSCVTSDVATPEDKVRRRKPVPIKRCVVPLHDNAMLCVAYTRTAQLDTADGTWFPTTIQPRLGPLGHSSFWRTGVGWRGDLGGRRFPCEDTIKADAQKWLREHGVSTYLTGV